jgi:hypothetical protein
MARNEKDNAPIGLITIMEFAAAVANEVPINWTGWIAGLDLDGRVYRYGLIGNTFTGMRCCRSKDVATVASSDIRILSSMQEWNQEPALILADSQFADGTKLVDRLRATQKPTEIRKTKTA